MTIHNLAVKDEPEHGDGDDGIEQGCHCCESCDGTEFSLWWWNGASVVICVDCRAPQVSVYWEEWG